MLIIGIGNEYRRDDGAGLIAARLLKTLHLPGTVIIEQNGEGAALIEAWGTAEQVILIDAVASGAMAGTLYQFNAHLRPIPSNFFSYSTHHFSVAEAVELMRVMGQLPPYLKIYGIEGKDFRFGTGLSWEVEKAVDETVKRIRRENYP